MTWHDQNIVDWVFLSQLLLIQDDFYETENVRKLSKEAKIIGTVFWGDGCHLEEIQENVLLQLSIKAKYGLNNDR